MRVFLAQRRYFSQRTVRLYSRRGPFWKAIDAARVRWHAGSEPDDAVEADDLYKLFGWQNQIAAKRLFNTYCDHIERDAVMDGRAMETLTPQSNWPEVIRGGLRRLRGGRRSLVNHRNSGA